MEKYQILQALKLAKENSPKRNFTQSIDLIVNLKGMDLKKTEQQVNQFIQLPHVKGKKVKICAIVAGELLEQAKSVCDGVIFIDDFSKYQKKADIKRIANGYDYFIAQATIMPKIATAFGRVFGPRGKMPNPKAGCVVPPNANLKPLVEKLQNTVSIKTKNDPIVQCCIGSEASPEDHIADNAMVIYNSLIHSLPQEKNNIRSIYIKLTMGKAVKIGEKAEDKEEGKKKGKRLHKEAIPKEEPSLKEESKVQKAEEKIEAKTVEKVKVKVKKEERKAKED